MNDAPCAHDQGWTHHQNVTSRGYVMPAYRVCEVCDYAETTPLTYEPISELSKVTAERDAALARLAKVEAVLDRWGRTDGGAEDVLQGVREAVGRDPEGGA